ncbi:MaoC family dehydratase [Acidovorax sp. Leaf78]|uniref:MaoC family dehydratase n=1 Tax=Acidovorax sp. Leaf78 TaxID=1736237 RepID=UPI0009E9FF67|nr:MaoC family dehydratase [Acidovorax sp. Leaf78]
MTTTLAAAAALPDSTQPQPLPLYLDDLAVGDRFTSGEHAMDEAQIKAFATQFDPQPFHLDEAAGRATLFGGLAASGWHTAAITMRLQVTTGLPIAGGIIGAGAEISWPRPTRATDVLHVVSEVLEIQPSRSKPDRGMVTVRSETRNQQGDVLQLSTVRIVVPRRQVAVTPGAAS